MQKHAISKASFEVAKRVYSKWYHDSIFCHWLSTIKRRVGEVWKVYSDCKRQRRETSTAPDKFRELRDKADKLFDVYTEDKTRPAVCEEKKFEVKCQITSSSIWKKWEEKWRWSATMGLTLFGSLQWWEDRESWSGRKRKDLRWRPGSTSSPWMK